MPPPSTEVEVVLPHGMKMVVPPGCVSARNYITGLYEKDVTAFVLSMVKEKMTVVDLGAYIGYYTLIASWLAGESGRVYSFEADPENYACLLRNISANDCDNVVAVQKAVDNRTGDAVLVGDTAAGRGWLSASPHRTASLSVQTISLDDFFAREGWPSIDLIKMDIEGSETAALEGMRELSHRNPKMQLIVEFNLGSIHQVGATVDSLAAVLGELGFRKGYIIERGMKPFSIAQAFPKSRAIYDLLLNKE